MSKTIITVDELKRLLANKTPIALLDVRTQEERQKFNIGGYHIPLSELTKRWQEIPKDQTLVVYCQAGGRSQSAVEYLSERDFEDVRNLVGGMLAWQRSEENSSS